MNFWGLKVYQGQKSIKDFQYSMETVLHHNKMCMTGLTSSKTVAQVMQSDKHGQTSTTESVPEF
jgi:hypothetical protein